MRVLPTMPVVLGYPGFWMGDPATGVDAVRLVAGEQAVELHAPLPVAGELVGRSRVTGLVDRGTGKGALLSDHSTMGSIARVDLAKLVVKALDDSGTIGQIYNAIDQDMVGKAPM